MDFDPKLLVKDKLGNTPLHYAAEKYPEVLNSMLKKAQGLGTQIKCTVVFLPTYRVVVSSGSTCEQASKWRSPSGV